MSLLDRTKKSRKILIVDDEYFLAEAMRMRLEFMGYDVLCRENGLEALTVLDQEKVDLIVMDCMMPGMDGYEATRKIRKDLQLDIPIIFLTALGRPEDREKALAAGASDYLTKPFEGTELAARIEKVLALEV